MLGLLSENRAAASAGAIETDSVAAAILAFAQTQREWEGSVSELMDRLAELGLVGVRWPRTPHHFSQRLSRAQTTLGNRGVRVTFPPRTKHGRKVKLEFLHESVTGVTSVAERASVVTLKGYDDDEASPSVTARSSVGDDGGASVAALGTCACG